VQGEVKLRGEELLAYFGKGSYDFGTGIPSLSAINSSSFFGRIGAPQAEKQRNA
jgi:hypothetical protein